MTILGWVGLAATTFGAALLQAAGGFGFAVVATPLLLMFVAPATAVHLVIIIATALSAAVLPGLWRAVEPRTAAAPAGGQPCRAATRSRRFSPQRSDAGAGRGRDDGARLCRAAGAVRRRTRAGGGPFAMGRNRDFAAGVVSGVATALVGMAGPPVLIYLLLAGAASQVIRATLLAYFALVYAVPWRRTPRRSASRGKAG